jgi:hypothetical protein
MGQHVLLPDGPNRHSVQCSLLCTRTRTLTWCCCCSCCTASAVAGAAGAGAGAGTAGVLPTSLTFSALRLSLWKSSPPHVRSMRAPTMPAFSMASSTSTLWLEGPSAHTSLVPAQPQQQQHNQQATGGHVVTKGGSGRCQLHRIMQSMVLPWTLSSELRPHRAGDGLCNQLQNNHTLIV